MGVGAGSGRPQGWADSQAFAATVHVHSWARKPQGGPGREPQVQATGSQAGTGGTARGPGPSRDQALGSVPQAAREAHHTSFHKVRALLGAQIFPLTYKAIGAPAPPQLCEDKFQTPPAFSCGDPSAKMPSLWAGVEMQGQKRFHPSQQWSISNAICCIDFFKTQIVCARYFQERTKKNWGQLT